MKKIINSLLNNKYIAIIWTIIIFVLLTLPSENLPSASNSDKIAHLGVFIIFTFLWLFHSKRPIMIIVSGFLFGIFIELWQSILPISFHRSGDIWDAVADAVGVIIGWGIYLFLKRISLN